MLFPDKGSASEMTAKNPIKKSCLDWNQATIIHELSGIIREKSVSLICLLIPKGEGFWQYKWELHFFLCYRFPLQGGWHYQHGLNWGHQRRLHAERSLHTWRLLSVLLVPQDSLHHVLEVARRFERLVSVWIQSIQPWLELRTEGKRIDLTCVACGLRR